MHVADYLELTPVAVIGLVLAWGMIRLFVYDSFGFRLSKRHDERIVEENRALDALVETLTPGVLAIRRQTVPQISYARYSFRAGRDGGALELDSVEIRAGEVPRPTPAASLPANCAPLARKLDSPQIRQALARFAKARRTLKPTDQVFIDRLGVSVVEPDATSHAGASTTVYIRDDDGRHARTRARGRR